MPEDTAPADKAADAQTLPPPPKPVRVGVCGAGFMSQSAYLQNISVLPNIEFVALAEIREPLREKVGARYEVPKLYADVRDMLAHEELDGVIVCVPFQQHGALIPEVLSAGKPVLMEMPLANSVEAGEAIVEAEKKYDTFAMVGYQRRSEYAVKRAHDLMQENLGKKGVGKLRYIRSCVPYGKWMSDSYLRYMQPEEGVMPEFETTPMSPDMDMETYQDYLTMLIYYSQPVNLIRYFAGEPITPVFADEKTMVVFRSDSGVSCTLETSPYNNFGGWDENLLVAFDQGYIDIDLPAPLENADTGSCRFLHQGESEREPQVQTYLPGMYSAFMQQIIDFAAAVNKTQPPPCTAADALETLKIVRETIRLQTGK